MTCPPYIMCIYIYIYIYTLFAFKTQCVHVSRHPLTRLTACNPKYLSAKLMESTCDDNFLDPIRAQKHSDGGENKLRLSLRGKHSLKPPFSLMYAQKQVTFDSESPTCTHVLHYGLQTRAADESVERGRGEEGFRSKNTVWLLSVAVEHISCRSREPRSRH